MTESGTFCYREIEEIKMAVIEIGSLQKKEAAAAIEASEQTWREKCCSICTSRINGRKGLAPIVERRPSTRKAQEDGFKWLKEFLFPLFSNYFRETFAYVNLLFSIGLLLLTIILLAIKGDKRNIADYVNLCLTFVSSFLNVVDASIIGCFYNCKLARDLYKCFRCCCKSCKDQNHTETQIEITPSKCCWDRCSCCDCCCCCVDVVKYCVAKADIQIEPEPSKCCRDGGTCNSCFKLCGKNKYADLIRLLLIEVFVYPITICSMLKVSLSIHLSSEDGIDVITGLSIVAFAASALWKVVSIYVFRFFAILSTICTIEKLRNPGPVAGTGRVYPYCFFVHVIMQMVAQILMIVCIAAKMYYENRNFPADNTIRISPYLWYMMFGGFFIPLAGIFTFLIYTYYYFQEYPIGFFLDLLHVIVAKEQGFKDEKKAAEAKKTDDVDSAKVRSDYDKIHAVSLVNKYGYVFQSPLLVVLSIVYALFLLAFAICCVLEPDPVTGVTNFVVLHGSTLGWVIFFALGVIAVNLLNVSVLLIAGVWITIIMSLIIIIALVISLILLNAGIACIFSVFSACASDNSGNNRHQH